MIQGSGSAPVFVDRTQELAQLARAAEISAQRAVTVLVEGAPGIGATALVERFAETAGDVVVVWATAARAEAHLAYGFADHLIAVLASTAPAAERGEELHRRSASAAIVGLELLDDIGRLEATGPVVLVLDDLEWADTESLAALRFALRRLGPERVLAVCVGRAGQGAWSMETADWTDRVDRIELAGLGLDATGEMIAALRGSRPSERLLRRVHQVTGGNPSFIRALCADWSSATDEYLLDRAEVVTSLAGAIGHVLETLPLAQSQILRALAVLDGPADVERVGAVAATGAEAARTAIDALRTSGLIRWRSDGIQASVALASSVWAPSIEAVTEPGELRRLHAVAATLTSPPQRWRHQVAAATANDLVLAAELELTSAAELLLWVRTLPGDDARADRVLLDAARLFVYAGRDDQARRLRRLVEDSAASPRRAAVLALLDAADGQLLTARDRLEAARQAATDAVERDRIDVDLAFVCTLVGLADGIDAALAGGARFRATWPEATDSLAVFAQALRHGPTAALVSLAASALPDEPARCSPAQLPLLAARGLYRGLTGQLELAIADLTVAARRRSGAAALMGNLPEVHVAWCQLMVGDLPAAARAIEVALDTTSFGLSTRDSASLLSLSAIVRSIQGDTAGAAEDAERASELVARRDYLGALVHVAMARYAMTDAAGRPEEVVATLSRLAIGGVETDRARLCQVWWLPGLADAQIEIGQLDAAEASLAKLRSLDTVGPDLPVVLAWIGGRLRAARGDGGGARRAYEQGLRIAGGADEPVWHRTLLREAFGRQLIGLGDPTAARVHLSSARQAFTWMGAAPYAARVDAVLADLDRTPAAPPPPRPSSSWSAELTDRERDVALLVGRGWTNPEIARELYLSPKTVEFHLGNVYAELGVGGRRELRDLVQREAMALAAPSFPSA